MSTPVELERIQFSLHAGRMFQAKRVGGTERGPFQRYEAWNSAYPYRLIQSYFDKRNEGRRSRVRWCLKRPPRFAVVLEVSGRNGGKYPLNEVLPSRWAP